MRTAFLGPEGTFTQEALDASGLGCGEPVPIATVYECVLAVQNREVDQAFAPIENSMEGSVTATLDALTFDAPDVEIAREITYPIRHCLITARKLRLDEIERVISHPHAKAQCGRFLRGQLSGAQLVAANSTADSVRTISGSEEPWAALGNELSASLYSCEVLRTDIEDSPDNRTRFVLLKHRADIVPTDQRDGNWKTSIVCGIGSDHPGALLEILEAFAKREVNLTKIESRPAKTGLGSYVFFIDMEGRMSEEPIKNAIDSLESSESSLRILGSYPTS